MRMLLPNIPVGSPPSQPDPVNIIVAHSPALDYLGFNKEDSIQLGKRILLPYIPGD